MFLKDCAPKTSSQPDSQPPGPLSSPRTQGSAFRSTLQTPPAPAHTSPETAAAGEWERVFLTGAFDLHGRERCAQGEVGGVQPEQQAQVPLRVHQRGGQASQVRDGDDFLVGLGKRDPIRLRKRPPTATARCAPASVLARRCGGRRTVLGPRAHALREQRSRQKTQTTHNPRRCSPGSWGRAALLGQAPGNL